MRRSRGYWGGPDDDVPESSAGSWSGIEQNLAPSVGTDAAWAMLPRRRCNQITDAGLAHLAKIPGLQSLDLG